MRRRLVWIQGGKVYGINYGFNRGGVSPFVARNTARGLIQLSDPTPPFAQTFDINENVGSSNITIIQNEQAVVEATMEARTATALTRSYNARNAMSVDLSLRLEQLGNTSNDSRLIFVRAFVNLFQVSPAFELIDQQELILYGNDPISTVREWSGILTTEPPTP